MAAVAFYEYLKSATTTPEYSPITLSNYWPKTSRLCFVVFFVFFGTLINAFYVASFFVERVLNKSGNVYLCCLGLADFIMTTCVMPVTAITLLADELGTVGVCNAMQAMTETSTYSYSALILLTSAESYLRLCCAMATYEKYMPGRHVKIIIPVVFMLSLSLGFFGVYMKLDYDYCERQSLGNLYYRWSTNIIFHVIPWIFTVFALVASYVHVRRQARRYSNYRRSTEYKRDFSITLLNMANFFGFFLSWFPYVVLIAINPNVSNSVFYTMTLVAVLRSVFTTFFYGMMNRYFRRAYSQIFNYCCCKRHLPSYHCRHRRAHNVEFKPITSGVRVHIMHKAVAGVAARNAAYCETTNL